jgi:acetaldehyde dehydrogenase
MMNQLKVMILGTGKLATDLLVKVLRSDHLQCTAFVGRNQDSKGIAFAKNRGVVTSCAGIDYIEKNSADVDLIFDVTTAQSHIANHVRLINLGKQVIDLTPSYLSHMIVPVINLEDAYTQATIGLISCGGQTALPMIHVLAKTCNEIVSIEVVSSIASKSAGPATRINIDEYVHKTESAIQFFSCCSNVKAMLILNPAEPGINMKTTIYVEAPSFDLAQITAALYAMEKKVQAYVPLYRIKVAPFIEKNRLALSLEVQGKGDFLPSYAGNLDIINCAAIQIAEAIALHSQTKYLCQS